MVSFGFTQSPFNLGPNLLKIVPARYGSWVEGSDTARGQQPTHGLEPA